VYKTYGELLRWHDKGFAIWEPLHTDEIKIGNVGYFDYHGGWQRVFDDIRDTLHPQPFDKEITIRSIKEEPECKFPSKKLANNMYFKRSFNFWMRISV